MTLKRTKPMPRGKWPAWKDDMDKRAAKEFARELEQLERRARNLSALVAAAPSSARGVISRITGITPAPKSPADRNQRVRELAEGEHCTYRYLPVCLFPRTDTTVLCHTNTQAHEKGMGYKGHDSEGVFACFGCHEVIDGRDLKHRPHPSELERDLTMAAVRTRARLQQIIQSPSERPWRKRAAQLVIDQQDARLARSVTTGETP